MSPTTIHIQGSTLERLGRMWKKKTAKMPPAPPPKYELRIVPHHGNEEMYCLASSDILWRRRVSSSSSPTRLAAAISPEATWMPLSSVVCSIVMDADYTHYEESRVRYA